jgi:Family of unknown function (DUF5691)
MNGWDEILSCALIGTDKKPVNITLLPDSVVALLAQKSDDNSTIALRSAAVLSFYNNVGVMPKQLKNLDFTIIKETQIVANDLLMLLFKEIELANYYEKENLLHLWLNCLIQREEIVQANAVLNVINTTEKLLVSQANGKKVLRAKMAKVLGETGKRILSLRRSNVNEVEEVENVWLEGKPEQRRCFFAGLRNDDPQKAMELLEKDWSMESVVFKKSLLEIISAPSDDELAFIEMLYQNEFAFKEKEKKTEIECRWVIARILLHSAKSKLYKTIATSLLDYIPKEKKGLLSKIVGGKKLKLILPEQIDSFFNPTFFQTTFGVTANNQNSAIFPTDVTYFFSELIALVPTFLWTKMFNCSAKDVFTYFLEDKQFKVLLQGVSKSSLINVVHENVKFSKSNDSILALLATENPQFFFDLTGFLSPQQFEQFVSENNLFTEVQVLTQFPKEAGVWSLAFSKQMMHQNYKHNVELQQSIYEVMTQIMTMHLATETKQTIDELFLKDDDSDYKQRWIENVYIPINRAITVKERLNSL